MSKVLDKASPMAKPLQPKTEAEAGKLKTSLSEAGFRSENAVGVFLGLKFIGLDRRPVRSAAARRCSRHGFTQKALMYTVVVGAGFMFYLPESSSGSSASTARSKSSSACPTCST